MNVGLDLARWGTAGHGRPRHGAAQQQGVVRQDWLRQGRVGWCAATAWPGMARHGSSRQDPVRTGMAGRGMTSSGLARCGNGLERLGKAHNNIGPSVSAPGPTVRAAATAQIEG